MIAKVSVNKQRRFIAHKIRLIGKSKSYVNPLPQEKMFEKPQQGVFFSTDLGSGSEFLATCHTLLLFHRRQAHYWEVLVVHPTWQPIKKQLEFCRAIEDKSRSPGCSIRTTAPYYPQGKINNSPQQYGADGSDRKSSPRTGVPFRRFKAL